MASPITNHYLRRIISQLKQQGVDFTPEDNILNDYDRYAYHLQLVMVNDRDSEDPDVDINLLDHKIRYIVVAESGVTAGFNITDCEIKDTVSHNFRTKNSSSVEVDMTIVEPYNMSLPDKLYEAAKSLAVLNWRLQKMFLILWFDKYDIDGNIVRTNPVVKVYKLTIVEISNTLTAAGTVYKLKFTVVNNLGFTNQYFIIPQSYNITLGNRPPPGGPVQFQPQPNIPPGGPTLPGAGARAAASSGSTVGVFFLLLEQELNKFYVDLRRNTDPDTPAALQAQQVVFYRFQVDADLGLQEIIFRPNVNNRRAGFSQVGNTVEITVGRGISIGNLVDDICASIKKVEWFIPDNQSGIVKVPWIECRVEYIGWDQVLNDYIKRFTFHIGVRETRRPIPTREFGQAFQLIQAWNEARLQAISAENNLRKAYLYFYTGNNTEIINLDVKFSLLHHIPLPLLAQNTVLPSAFSALSASQSQMAAAVGRRAQLQTEQTSIAAQLAELSRTRSQLNPDEYAQRFAALTARFDQIDTELAQLGQVVAGRSLVIYDPETANILQRTVDGSVINYLEQARNLTEPDRQRLEQARAAAAARRRQSVEFAEDITTQALQVSPTNLTYLTDPRDLVNFVRAVPSGSDGQSRQLYSSITTQIYERKQDMVNITMEIRGDPYWLGRSNSERDRELINKEGDITVDVADLSQYATYSQYDNYFLLAFRAGTIPNESTGFMNLKDDVDFFNALYCVIEVTHIFREGKFTQQIQATRDLLSNFGGTAAPAEPQQRLPG
jgi:hypothetical protein